MTASDSRSASPRRPRRTLLWTFLAAGLLALAWGALIATSVVFGWTQRPLAPRGDAPAFAAAVAARLDDRASGIQDRDGGGPLLAASRHAFPFIEGVFADGG